MKAKAVGMRKLSSPDVVATALNTLKGAHGSSARCGARRAQEYEAKINSGTSCRFRGGPDLHRATVSRSINS
jgi:CarD family transcriptional regulator